LPISIANCQLKESYQKSSSNGQSAIANRQSECRMVDPPRLTKLGAKWVEVRKRRAQGFRSGMMRAYLKTWPATPVDASLNSGLKGLPKLVGVASFTEREQPGSINHSKYW